MATIAAIATPWGSGGVGVVRISGPKVPFIAKNILGQNPQPRIAKLARFLDENNEPLDIGLVLYFPAPNSFTGEDVLELQGHGGMVVLDRVLQRVLALGARIARPGEFSERAFLNGKMDLAQCEAVADLINAKTWQAAKGAMRSLGGEFSQLILTMNEAIISLRMYVEAALDFPEEEIDFLSDGKILNRLEGVIEQLTRCFSQSQNGALLREGARVVIIGRPNVGKSSLLNVLAGYEKAIVTDIPGTTRDCIQETIQIEGIPLHIIDTAGLREAPDRVEKEGILRAKAQMQEADCVLHVLDVENKTPSLRAETFLKDFDGKVITCVNKIDLTQITPGQGENEWVYVSAKTNAGIDVLREILKNQITNNPQEEGVFVARARHLQALDRALSHCLQAKEKLVTFEAGELVAELLRDAQKSLSEILGEFSSNDLLDKIFSSFCIGK